MLDMASEDSGAVALSRVQMGNRWPWLLVAAAAAIIVAGAVAGTDSAPQPTAPGTASPQSANLAPG